MRPFHLAFPVDNLDTTREFYTKVLGCKEGRSSDRWIDFDMYGHQVVAHLVDSMEKAESNPVDGAEVPASLAPTTTPANQVGSSVWPAG